MGTGAAALAGHQRRVVDGRRGRPLRGPNRPSGETRGLVEPAPALVNSACHLRPVNRDRDLHHQTPLVLRSGYHLIVEEVPRSRLDLRWSRTES
ncbi:MAG: hypothetical protein CL468_05185 [Acidimicrobiaceae bacterium]|nr:hypothetical protein [Acidimicrobiaceae bacterium]